MWFSKSANTRTYLDYASATPLFPEATAAMREAEKLFGNPGAIHAEAVAAKNALHDARDRIALILCVRSRELIFTAGLTEANNLAIVGFARKLEQFKRTLCGTHWIVSAIEHASVLECFSEIERMGGEVSHVLPNEKGIITTEAVAVVLKPQTVFVSVGWANNEIGVIQPLGKIARGLRAHEEKHGTAIIFHSDAGQAPVYESTVVHSLGVDLLSISASKLYGPHGVGCLYLSNRTELAPVVLGGDQERGLRAGTENVALVVGFAAAFEALAKERHSERRRVRALRDRLVERVKKEVSGVVVNGDPARSLPHMLNISIPASDTEYVCLALDHEGFAVSTKSACNEGEKASHVIEALGTEKWRAEHTLRISLGRATSESEIVHFADALSRITSHAIVPEWTSRN